MRSEERPMDGYQQAVKYNRLSERISIKLQAYWALTKSKQTFLLLITGWAGFASAGELVTDWVTMISLLGSLYLAISGSTVLNMYMDRDIDAQMPRTIKRPLPSGVLRPREALAFGSLISLIGVVWAFTLGSLFGVVVAAGLFFHTVVYTMWLKRSTAFSVIPGGVSGGMPVLAGRVLGTGSIDLVGILLAVAILLWIPIHILTFAMRYAEDYKQAKVPTFPAIYGEANTRLVLAASTVLTGLTMLGAVLLNGVQGPYLMASILAAMVLIGLAVFCVAYPTPKRNFLLFKGASLYMLASMVLLGLAG